MHVTELNHNVYANFNNYNTYRLVSISNYEFKIYKSSRIDGTFCIKCNIFRDKNIVLNPRDRNVAISDKIFVTFIEKRH